ncbi:hypothetical protein CHS0354_040055 [Potamilus streckersoni]|nr:hypothetical protein CHS0354_040055 [Potamilus streckersoni]
MLYTGKNYGESAPKAKGLCRYYIGVFDKKRGKMKVCDAEMFNLRPFINVVEKESTATSLSNDLSYIEKKDKLTSAFGSSRKRKAMESRLRNKVEAKELEKAMGSAVEMALSQERLNPPSTQDSFGSESSLIPPCNKDAQRVEDVYNLHDLISTAELEELTSSAKVFFDSTVTDIRIWKVDQIYPKYIVNHLSSLPLRENERWLKAKCLTYLSYLINLFNMKAKDLKRKDPLPREWPNRIRRNLSEKFTVKVNTNDGKKIITCIPARLKDKLLCHILVLALIIDDFSVEVGDLQMDTKVGVQRMQTHFQALGCQMKTHKIPLGDGQNLESRVALLKLPLVFPEMKPKTGKKRK